MAALAHFYPGYTLDTLRDLPLWEFRVLLAFMEEANRGR